MLRSILQLLLIPSCLYAQPRFVTPIQGEHGKDFIISSYYDHGKSLSQRDYNCGNRTYDQHTGTDFAIRGFEAMDSGVNVLAAAEGLVIYVQDEEFDREAQWLPGKGWGNAVGIQHNDTVTTYYGHLKKNSLLVKEGDSVRQGQVIAQVGSSGKSSGPHLHFEVWKNQFQTVDPFAGNCGDSVGYWLDPLPYNCTFRLWRSGLSKHIPTYKEIRTKVVSTDSFYLNDTLVVLWGTMLWLQKKDRWRVEWRAPDGFIDATYIHPKLKYSMSLYSFAPSFYVPTNGPFGKWSVRLYRNRDLVVQKEFYVIKGIRR